MTYCAIATVLHSPTQTLVALEAAISFARKNGAHLFVLCAGVDRTEAGYYYAGAQTIAYQLNLEQAQADAAQIEAIVRKRLNAEDINWDVGAMTVMPGGLISALSDTMRFYDLVFLPAPYQPKEDHIGRQIFETCLFHAGSPILIVPESAKTDCVFDRLLVGWDDGQQAMASVRAARPLIVNANVAEITIIDPPAHGPNRSDPGGRLAAHLAHAGASVDINILARTLPSVAAQLLQRALDRNMDLIVMGAYGHSPLREAILGGATRDMLRKCTLPILMAH